MNSVIGALVGDAAGATLEFYGRKPITEEVALAAMKMPGGGKLRVGPGQITDDGELTLSLWMAIKDASGVFPYLQVAKAYAAWYESCPFDIGRTCSNAFEAFSEYFKRESFRYANFPECMHDIHSLNRESEANGALMRASAICSLFAKNLGLSIMLAMEYAKEDALLSHPSLVCQEVNKIYVFAATHILRGKAPEDVIPLLDFYIQRHVKSEKVRHWYFEESLDISDLDCTQNMGHVRWAFVLAMFFLRKPWITYEDAIKRTLMKGGDTDTNAAIVGGLVSCYQPPPEYMIKPVMAFDCTKESERGPGVPRHHWRPAAYSVKRVFDAIADEEAP